MAVIGARTGHGKTAFLINLLVNWLTVSGNSASPDGLFLLYSSEEHEVRVYHRLLTLLSSATGKGWKINEVRRFLRDPQSRDTWPVPTQPLEEADRCLRLWEGRLYIVYRPCWSVAELEAHARGLAKDQPVAAILLDYLQRIPAPPGGFDRRDLEVSAVARTLKRLAVDLSTPVVVAAQINRDVMLRAKSIPEDKSYEDKDVQKAIRSRRPELHHLREGGSEQEADLVLGLLNYRADYMEDAEKKECLEDVGLGERGMPDVTRLEVGVLKNRYGPMGRWTPLAFEASSGHIRDPKRYGEV